MKTPEERGRWGRWLRDERMKRGLSPEQVREMLAARGYQVGESSYAEWESGYKPRPTKDAIPHLIGLWGSEPPDDDEPAATDNGSTAAMLKELVAEVRASRLAQERTNELMLELMAATLPDRGGSPSVGAPPGHAASDR